MADYPRLSKVGNVQSHQFETPTRRIHDGADVSFFLTSLAYRDIMTFVLQLNRSVIPRKLDVAGSTKTVAWPLNSANLAYSDSIKRLRALLTKLINLVDDTPPDTGPRRFGNVSFRKWHKLVEDRMDDLLNEALPEALLPAQKELRAYLLESFGSPQRLDYGTGHELSFLAFLACLWKVNFFTESEPWAEERGIVLGVFELYLSLIRKLIKTYTLEPAGSHGVWGLDDNSFLPYIFGSAQLAPAISETDDTPLEGSLADAPEASWVTKQNLVEKEKETNMYFSAIAFIYDVKKGPFWEHSPMLFDISGIKDGWGKINKGMIKMYNAEVLSKFPVVQHFPFGSLFKWEKDPESKPAPTSTHASSQPLRNPMDTHAPSTLRPPGPPMAGGTAAPGAATASKAPVGFVGGVTQAPWASRSPAPPPPRGGLASAQRKPLPPLNERTVGQGQKPPSEKQ
ncbi:Serine/threonine-protein phosphatase 2A activator 1 [Elasticomyces elasticus]|uniref:Serine/threonine-protein phosphatase 2A activator n=1 Tax=Exophiala sideris TaxID=1016849 RepID=A0ABR0JRZ5_9EURO|nr:Serine/threonine-protein phosphatase 2A activator 1 [Elasticomyces elasticus]KAK5034609.1 Serine/threonine-protein phosphatase 2A activator 1 [Exophiala sideris]KAK5040069.1 Serine/threonine-protein phosphatase 2A activator 1 [Exophiala sideris]KAK5068447.1 Serine/threonine-protein phosphatase 2A activator 1 [Exophiala sideris]KAK5187749.1 Serine/threonine-protein phosphatase 2A activator 1 [Eurotiomycetes sp. CCFEE 6388]